MITLTIANGVSGLAVAGFVLALFGLGLSIWNFTIALLDRHRTFTLVELTCTPAGNRSILTAKIDNSRRPQRRVGHALLVIGPEGENPIETFNETARSHGIALEVQDTNSFHRFPRDSSRFDGSCRAVIPLPFFYSENIAFGDEILTYSTSLRREDFPLTDVLEARFFLYPDDAKKRYHRSTQALVYFNTAKNQ